MKRIVSAGLIAMCVLGAGAARAWDIGDPCPKGTSFCPGKFWSYYGENQQQFDNGSHPSAALGMCGANEWAVEVHQGATGALWGSAGLTSGNPIFSAASQYANGNAPAIAALATGQAGNADLIEVHQAVDGQTGPLWYDVATVGCPGLNVTWYEAWNYDNGYAPQVAAASGYVVEVHQAAPGIGALWYHFGTIAPGSLTVTWADTAVHYDDGTSPAVALVNTLSGVVAVEVHASGSGRLWYHTGTVTASGVTWGPSNPYDYGYAPSVAAIKVNGLPSVIEAHQASDGAGDLWSNFGVVESSSIYWYGPGRYATGYSPTLAANQGFGRGFAFSAASTGSSPLWLGPFKSDNLLGQ